MKILQHFAKNTYMSHSATVPDFSMKEVESFYFNLHCIYEGKQNSAPLNLKTLEKFVQPANENFTTFCKKKTRIRVMAEPVPGSGMKEVESFCFNLHFFIKGRLNNGPLYLKTLEKFVQPANESFQLL